MIKMTKILYPTDFSDLSLVALRYAKSFAEQFEAELHCVHVLDEAYQYWLMLGPDGVPAGPNLQDLVKTTQDQMAQFVEKHLAGFPRLTAKVISGRPFVEIIHYARNMAMDLIVIATHGRSGLKHVLMGSVAERVVRKAPCPVLSVRSDEHGFVMP